MKKEKNLKINEKKHAQQLINKETVKLAAEDMVNLFKKMSSIQISNQNKADLLFNANFISTSKTISQTFNFKISWTLRNSVQHNRPNLGQTRHWLSIDITKYNYTVCTTTSLWNLCVRKNKGNSGTRISENVFVALKVFFERGEFDIGGFFLKVYSDSENSYIIALEILNICFKNFQKTATITVFFRVICCFLNII